MPIVKMAQDFAMVLRRQGDDVLFRAIVGRAPFVERKLRAGPSSFARLAPAAASIRAVRSQAVTLPGLSGFVLANALVVLRTEGCPTRATSVSVQGTGGSRRHDWHVCGGPGQAPGSPGVEPLRVKRIARHERMKYNRVVVSGPGSSRLSK
jgi:hypothetical protein